jgi:O-antigen/teichoic acid export membrane protein
LLCAVVALLVSIKQLNEGYLLGRSRSVVVAAHESLTRPIVLVAVLYALSKTSLPNAHTYLIAMALTLGFITLSHIAIMRPLVSRRAIEPIMPAKDWWAASYPFFLLTTAVTVQHQAGVFVLGFLDTDAETGLFAVAVRISTVLSFAMVATSMVYMGSYSQAYAAGDTKRLNQDVRAASLFTAAFALLAFVVLVTTTSFWLRLFGEGFVAAGTMLEIQAVALLVGTLCGPAAILLSMTDFAREASRIMLVAALLNILLTVVLVLLWRGVGAAIANLITVTWSSLVLVYLVRKRLNVRSGVIGMLLPGSNV